MTDRDTFAAAALTGLLATGQGPYHGEDYFAKAAYKAADAMLRERGRTNHDAAPEATADGQGRDNPVTPDHVGTGNTQEPVAWAVTIPLGRGRYAVDDFFMSPKAAKEACDLRIKNTSRGGEVIPLYRHPQPTLTDDEREAILGVIDAEHRRGAWQWADTLSKLLERMK